MPVSADYNSKCFSANDRGFPYLRKSEGEDKMATRNKSWADNQSLEEALQNYKDKVCKEKKF